MSVNFGAGIGAQDGDNFQEAGGKPLPPAGWGEFAIMSQKEYEGNLIICCQNKAGQECDVYLGFAGSESWQKDQAAATLGKIIQATGYNGRIKTMQDAVNLNGLKMDIKIQIVDSKKKKDDGTFFKNARSKNYATAGTRSSVAATPPPATETAASPW